MRDSGGRGGVRSGSVARSETAWLYQRRMPAMQGYLNHKATKDTKSDELAVATHAIPNSFNQPTGSR
jgi:hypothetical protein